jgi:hypothetical protein
MPSGTNAKRCTQLVMAGGGVWTPGNICLAFRPVLGSACIFDPTTACRVHAGAPMDTQAHHFIDINTNKQQEGATSAPAKSTYLLLTSPSSLMYHLSG